MSVVHRTASEEETRRLAAELAAGLKRGDVVALYGDLGAGKTQFVKGLCAALSVKEPVSSPTFVTMNRYSGRDARGNEILVYHFDLYRVRSSTDILELGYEEFLFGNGISMIEWADRLYELLPDARYDVSLKLGAHEEERIIEITHVLSVNNPSPKGSS